MEGFGQKSYDNLISSIETASHTTLPRLIYGLGIAGIGLANAKMLCRHFNYDLDQMRHCNVEELTAVDGIGGVLAQAWVDYFASEKNNEVLDHLLQELHIEKSRLRKWYCLCRNDLCYYRFCRAFCKQKRITGTDRE